MPNTRELSQLASLININDETKSIRVLVDQPDAKIGVGTENPIAKVDISGDVNVSGVVTATGFYGDGSNLSNIISGVGIATEGGTVGTGATVLDFRGAGISTVTVSSGIATINIQGVQGGVTSIIAGSGISIDQPTGDVTISATGGGGGGIGVTETKTTVSTTNPTGVGSFATATHRSADVILQITQGTNYQVGRYLMIHDGSSVTMIEESSIATNAMLGSFNGAINGSNAEIRVTLTSAGIATVTAKIDTITIP